MDYYIDEARPYELDEGFYTYDDNWFIAYALNQACDGMEYVEYPNETGYHYNGEKIILFDLDETTSELKEADIVEQMKRIINSLDDREQAVIKTLYGLDDGRLKDYEETSLKLGLYIDEVKSTEKSALRKMRSL